MFSFIFFELDAICKKIGVNIYFDYFIYGLLSNLFKLKGIFERKHRKLGSELLICSKSNLCFKFHKYKYIIIQIFVIKLS